MVQVPTKPMTLAQFLDLPETKPASEYINGDMIQKPMPQGQRSILQRELSFVLTAIFRANHQAQAFPELRCTFGTRSIVPDIAIFTTARIPKDSNGNVANVFSLPPDWTIEILSPQQNQTKVIRNILYCLDHGTEMGWLLDPEESSVFVYGKDKSVRIFEEADSTLPTPAFAQALQLTIGEIFDWLKA